MEERFCIFDDQKICDHCGDCDSCDLDPEKICDNCGKCIVLDKDYETIEIDAILGLDKDGDG